MTKIAMCETCNVPLVMTFAFSGKEFVCLDCGWKYGYLGPVSADETPELLELMNKYKTEFVENAGQYLLTGGIMLKSCSTCRDKHEPHIEHATDEEKKASDKALEWLSDRRKG